MLRVTFSTLDSRGVLQRTDLAATAAVPGEWGPDLMLDVIDGLEAIGETIGYQLDWRITFAGNHRGVTLDQARHVAALQANDQGGGPGRLADEVTRAAEQLDQGETMGDNRPGRPGSGSSAALPAGSAQLERVLADLATAATELGGRLDQVVTRLERLEGAPAARPTSSADQARPTSSAATAERGGLTREQRRAAALKAAETRRANRQQQQADQADQADVDAGGPQE
jgi:hypothetical protein